MLIFLSIIELIKYGKFASSKKQIKSHRKIYFIAAAKKSKNLENFPQKLIILALALIGTISCESGWIKGPDGYRYRQPNQPLTYPILDESLPPINLLALNENGPEPIEANEFAPYFSKTLLEDIEATTFEYELVQKK